MTLALAGAASAHSVVANKAVDSGADAAQFTCADTIYLHVLWSPLLSGEHVLSADWHNTTTDLSHQSQITTASNTPASYLWLRFDPGDGAGFSRVLSSDNGYGDFAGDWSVQLLLDGQPFAVKRFNIQC
jgi:hypothetical protein